MDASETTKDLFTSWMKWQQKATDMWGKVAQGGQRPPWAWPPAQVMQPVGAPDLFREWSQMYSDLFKRYSAFPAPGVGAETAFKSADALKVYSSLYEFWTRWVQTMSPVMGKDPMTQDVVAAHRKMRDEYEKVVQAFLGSQPSASMHEFLDMQGQSLGRFASLWKHFQGPWESMSAEWPAQIQKLMSGDPMSTREGLSLWQKAVLDTVGKLLHMPSLGMSREYEERVKATMDAYLQFQAILPVYYSTFQSASRDAFEKLLKESKDLNADASPEGFRKFYRKWITVHEDAYFELFRKPEFADLMNRVVNRGVTLRQRVNELSTKALEVWNIPTHKQMDDVYRTLYEHRKQIKALARKVEELENRGRG